MKTRTLSIPYTVARMDELAEEDRLLIEAAKRMTAMAYAPYSKFNVGAAIRLADAVGTVVCGSNQENAAFPSGICAERTACYQAGAIHPGVPFDAIAIAAATGGDFTDEPVTPCGACRQALLEYETLGSPRKTRVLLYGKKHIYVLPSVSSLLPLAFTEL